MLGLKKREKEHLQQADKVDEVVKKVDEIVEKTIEQDDADIQTVEEKVVVEEEIESETIDERAADGEAQQEEQGDDMSRNQDGLTTLARALGKTESGLKSEFYLYQIKELLSKLGNITSADAFSKNSQVIFDLIKHGAGYVVVTPVYFELCRAIESRIGKGKIKFATVIDYPNGESSFKAQLVDVKNAVRFGLDTITVTVPNADVVAAVGGIKARLNKLSRAARHGFGYAIVADGNEETLKKTLKSLDGIKAEHVMLIVDKLDKETALKSVKAAAELKGKKRLIVYTTLAVSEDISSITELNADAVYTKSVNSIAAELYNKFGIKI